MIKSSGKSSEVLDRIWSQGQPHLYLCEFFNNLLFISYWNYWNKKKNEQCNVIIQSLSPILQNVFKKCTYYEGKNVIQIPIGNIFVCENKNIF